jgi:hypothetical protein
VIISEEDHLVHYGVLRRSGRYPWGSGGDESESARNRSLLQTLKDLQAKGMSQTEIARGWDMTTTELRAHKTQAIDQQRHEKQLQAFTLREKGYSNQKIAEQMGLPNESSVRSLLSRFEKDEKSALQTTADMIKAHVDEKKYVDVGKGVEYQLGITDTRLKTAVAMLRNEGYELHTIHIETGPYRFTAMKVLARPGTTLKEVNTNRAQIKQIMDFSEDNGRSFIAPQKPISVSSKRIKVNYAEDGGAKADGMIWIRPGVSDLAIGSKRYGQVRIMVDGTHYLKGMAHYKDDLPEGVDIVFNTNKKNTGKKKDALKPLESDPDLPFGSIVRQSHDAKGKVNSAVNLVGSPTKTGSGEEGHWDSWSRNLASQVLSKQSPELATQQLNVTFERHMRDLNEIRSLTNPTVRRELLIKFADSADSSAVHLHAAELPRQATKVLIPIASIKPNEIYAPTMRDGERVALIRYPHGGTFEIPQLTVNNRNREARKVLGTGKDSPRHDSVGIHHTVAQRLSGADFDGDTVLVIPNNSGSIKSTNALKDLEGFDPQKYKISEDSGIPRITDSQKQKEMGKVSNLITDMSLHGAPPEEIARAVKHSMVVIDSEKHQLNYVQSEKDHGILDLKEKYQGGKRGGAQTLISRAGAEARVDQREPRRPQHGGPIDPQTGERVFTPTGKQRQIYKVVKERNPKTGKMESKKDPITGRTIKVPTGRYENVKVKSVKLAETKDAFTLVGKPRTQMEVIYATHSNKLKALANTARKEAVHTPTLKKSNSAAKVYAPEVESLTSQIHVAKRNAPLERQAQLLANAEVTQKRQANPALLEEDVKKIKTNALNVYRARTGAKRHQISISDKEWEAIQAGALSPTKLNDVLRFADPESVKKHALPKDQILMTSNMKARATSMQNSGFTLQEIADQLGVGLTTLKVGLE